jgi:uncharacterized protein YbcI
MSVGEGPPADLNREISRAMVALFKEYTGRGPTSARTYIHDDLVVCLFHDLMTQAERTLAEDDHQALVQEFRRTFQGSLRDDAITEIERLTGRKVSAFMSDHAIEPDFATEVFVLESESSEDGK